MKILFAYNFVKQDNEYVKRLVEISSTIDNADVTVSLNEFWNPSVKYDFVVINWPDYLFDWRLDLNEKDVLNLENIFKHYKKDNTKIITVLHDEYSHIHRDFFLNKIFDICYYQSDKLIHLGEYSCEKYKSSNKYLKQEHFIVYHPLFKEFNFNISKEQARIDLSIPKNVFYIIVPGGIRHTYEYDYVFKIYKRINIKNKRLHFLRSTSIKKPKRGWNYKFLKFKLNEKLVELIKGVKHSYKFMDSELLSKHFAASDLIISSRVDILNSGNITLASQFNKFVIGFGIGNINEWLIKFNHYAINYKFKDNLENINFTQIIKNKKEEQMTNNIYEYSSDDVIKKQLKKVFDR